MQNDRTDAIRNLALIGPAGTGKTSLAEALLHAAGAIKQRGRIERGDTVCDFDAHEVAMAHSLDTAVCHLDWKDTHINLIDTPGFTDFLPRAVAVLPAVECAALVLSAAGGLETGARRMMKAAGDAALSRIIIVNKMDTEPDQLGILLEQIQEAFGKRCLPVNLPSDHGRKVLDCFFRDDGQDADFSSTAEAHTHIIDQVVEVDEALMEAYLESGQNLDPQQLHDAFEKALRERHLIPVFFVSAETGAGVNELLDYIVKLMPSPREANPPPFMRGEGEAAEPVVVTSEPDSHVVAHVFKVVVDPYVGRTAVLRLHQGTIRAGSQLFVGDARKPIKLNHLFKLQGKQNLEVDSAGPGDIVAVTRIDSLDFNDVLHDSHDEDHFHVRLPEMAPPMMGVAIEPAQRGNEQKLSDALHKLRAEDPALRVEHRPSTNETVVLCSGELHLRLVLDAMKERFNVDVQTHLPTIPYRETITRPAEGHHRHKKQTGGAGQFGEVYLRIAPLPRGSGFEFASEVVGGTIPQQFIPAVEKGVRQALESGAIAGFPLQDIRVAVYDGKTHPVDSKEVAFISAGRRAFLEAIRDAGPIVLEPIVQLQVTVPIDALGTVTGHLSQRRGRMLGSTSLSGQRIQINAEAPLAELQDYANQLKSITGGSGAWSMQLDRYEPVPAKVQQDLVSATRPAEVE
ncbi:elongation factor G [Thioalkalivibrio sp. XN8]|uniref:elongation factor G n=1 Tax=Thioalkalivibrio sp. XN8 TaxID=2712863 RepID=UPI0013EB4DA8|nr:elongation factor G [Thioalkalivibrio sp. XN8]NGP54372.1 elongation factor G [Thioalkalivibrio sp. XN8]